MPLKWFSKSRLEGCRILEELGFNTPVGVVVRALSL